MLNRTGISKSMLWILATVAVIIIFQISYGLACLQPSNINWLMSIRHDWGQHYLGWAFYKNEPWHFPLGKVTGFNYPVGTNVGFTDSIPLLAIFFKIFAPLLSNEFQYFGIWLFLCHLLIAYFTILLFRLFKVNSLITLAAVIFITANPELLHRGMHPALCGQWVLVASIYFYFLDPQTTDAKKILLYQFALLAISSLINPYLCWMVLGFTFATPLKLWFYEKAISRKTFFIYLIASIVSLILIWYVAGMITFSRKEDLWVNGSYGLYAFNLNSLFNSGGWSALIPPLKQVSWHQYESFMYLGAGMLILLFVLLLYYGYLFIGRMLNKEVTPERTSTKNKRLVPLYILIGLYAIFAITLRFTLNDKVLLQIPAPGIFIQLEETFRACARFFWVPYYLIIIFTIIGLAKSGIKPVLVSSLIFVALAVQLYDIKLLLTFRTMPRGTYTPPMDKKDWIRVMGQFDEILFYPPFETPNIRFMDYQDFAYLALKAGKPVNIGYVARADSRAMKKFGDSLTVNVENGRLSPKALYITNAANLGHFSLAFQLNAARLNMLDSCFYIYSGELKNSELDALAHTLNGPYQSSLDSALTMLRKKTEFVETVKVPIEDNKAIRYWVQYENINEKFISMEGFSFIEETKNNKGDSIFITLTSTEKSYIVPATIKQRPDVTGSLKRPYLDDSGFIFMAFTDSVQKGNYQLGIAIKNAQGRFLYQPIGKEIKIKSP